MVKYLIEKGGDVNSFTRHGQVLLSEVLEEKNREVAMLLLESGADPNSNERHDAPVMIAAKQNDVEMVKLMIQKGLRLDIKDDYDEPMFDTILKMAGKDVKKFLEENYMNKYGAESRHSKRFAPVKVADANFSNVVGMEHVKDELRKDIIYHLKNQELAKEYKVELGGGILLFGPPGCGKTFIVKAVAGETGANLIEVKISQIFDRYVGSENKAIRSLFATARKSKPCIIFIDEVELLGNDRATSGPNVWMREALTMLLTELDGISSSNEGVLIVGATNAPWMMDPALKRHGRMGKLIYVPPPSKEMRKQLFKTYLEGRPLEADIDYDLLAESSAECNVADIKAVCSEAAKIAWQDSLESGNKRKICTNDLTRSLKKEKYNMKEWFEKIQVNMQSEANKNIYSELHDAIHEMEGEKATSIVYR